MLFEFWRQWFLNLNKPSKTWYRTNWKNYKILVVDDDSPSLALLSDFLSLSTNIFQASTGKQACSLLEKNVFDVVILDIMLPDISGIDIIQEIRTGKYGNKDVPALAITAHASEQDRKYLLAVGFNFYVAKPIGLTQVLEILDKVL